MTPNQWRWAAALVLGFAAGVVNAIADSPKFPGWYPLFRDGITDMVPAIIALKMTLMPNTWPTGVRVEGGPPASGASGRH